MALEVIFFVGAFVLMLALIYGTYRGRFQDRATERASNDIVRRRYRGRESRAAHWTPQGKPPADTTWQSNGLEPDFSEDDIQRKQFGPRGVPGAPDPAKMTPQRQKKTPSYINQGHVS